MILLFVEKDKSLTLNEKNIIKERVNNRMKIIEEELARNLDEEIENEENEENKKTKSGINELKEETEKKPISKKNEITLFHLSKEEEKEKRLTEVLTERLNEYKAALEYFKSNDFPELQKETINKVNKINSELQKIQLGKWNEVNEYDLPDPITPEFIYGYDKEERKRRFDKIISEMSKERDLIKEEMKKKLEFLKKLSKEKLKQILPDSKKEFYTLKEKKMKYEEILSLLREKYQDKWTPAPLFIENEEELSVEKINDSVPGNILRIIFGKTNYHKSRNITFPPGEKIFLRGGVAIF